MDHDTRGAQDQPADGASDKVTAPMNRRTMLRAGAAATPVLLTLASGPVSATGSYNCVVASSFVSATTFKSRNGGTATVNCTKNTWTCDSWHSNAGSNPCDSLLTRTVTTCLGSAGPYTSKTCQWVMQQSSSPDRTTQLGVCQHLIALVNNCDKSGVNVDGVFNKTYLQGVWSDFCAGNFPRSNPAGSKWDATKTVNWLRVMLGYSW